MILYETDTKLIIEWIKMSKKSRSLINKETNLIRRFMEQNLELGKSHEDIIQQLNIK